MRARIADAPADIVFTNGAVCTMNAGRDWAEAVAVREGRIADVGTAKRIEAAIGPRTRVIDLRRRTLLPGFQDAHVHPTHGGMYRLRCELHDVRGRDAVLATIARYAQDNPGEAWIRGGGWHMADFPGGTPRREDLDRVVSDRPAFLVNRDVHGAWVNTRALELAGVGRNTPDPRDGRIERDSDGTPSGTLHEGAMRLVADLVPSDTAVDRERALLIAQEYLHSLGITAWQDAWVADHDLDTYCAVAERGELTARVVGALWWDRLRGEEQIEELLDKRARGRVGRFAATSVKIMQDGVAENFTAAVLEPYLGADGFPTTNRGISFVDPAVLRAVVTRLDREGFQVHFHALAERAVREALDALETARRANGAGDNRHHLAHLQIVHPDDLPRFRALDAAANAQPLWACLDEQMEELTIPFLGAERVGWQYPFRSLERAGATLAMGSDWSVSSPNPLLEIEVAVNRVSPESRGRKPPFLPDECLDLPSALRAFTMGSAYVNHLDHQTGSVEPGKAADLVVLDRDLFDRGAGEIGDARVVATFVEGQAVYEDAALDG